MYCPISQIAREGMNALNWVIRHRFLQKVVHLISPWVLSLPVKTWQL